MSRKPVLVTGGAGFIGSSVTDLLLKDGYPVFVVDNLSRGYLAAVPLGAVFYEASVQQTEVLREIIIRHSIDSVIHCAALIRVGESLENPQKYFANNTDGTQSLLSAIEGTSVHRFIFSSTAAVYGETASGFVTESSATAPMNPYGESKLRAEELLRQFAKNTGQVDVFVLRYFNVAGADLTSLRGPRDKEATQLIRVLAQTALGLHSQIDIFGQDYPTPDGSCVRDFIHIKDLASAHLAALDLLTRTKGFEIFNLGYGHGASVLECLRAMQAVAGKEIPHRLSHRRGGDPACVVADSSKAQTLFNLQWQHEDLIEICRDSLAWERRLLQDVLEKAET